MAWMKKHIALLIVTAVTLGWMMLIFSFSAQTGEESGGLSAKISQPITKMIVHLSGGMSVAEEAALYLKVDGVVRTGAHFTEYAVLGIWLTLLLKAVGLLKAIGLCWLWLAWLGGTIFAVTDEWHQSFTPGRVSDPADVLVDSLGLLLGVSLTALILKKWRKKHVHHS